MTSAGFASPVTNHRFLVIPWMSASSDEGITLGLSVSSSVPASKMQTITMSGSSKEYFRLGFKGDFISDDRNILFKLYLSKIKRYSYIPESGYKTYSAADMGKIELRFSALNSLQNSGNFYCGADINLILKKKIDKVDGLGDSYAPSNDLRFRDGQLIQAGVRFRYFTDNPHRPLHGWNIDNAVYVGPSFENTFENAVFGVGYDISIARTQRLTEMMRFYFRSTLKGHTNAPPPVQPASGGETTIRGIPAQFDFGESIKTARFNVYCTVLTGWKLPFRIAHAIFSYIPAYAVDVELDGFYDIGTCDDLLDDSIVFQQGYGGGFRVVVPPDLVFFLDVGIAPHGNPRFYMGLGETL